MILSPLGLLLVTRWTIWLWYLRDSECMASSWNLLSATCSRRRCHFWDILLVGEDWNATRERSRTLNRGRFRIVLRAVASSWALSVITDDLYLILLTSRHPWWPWRERTSRSSGNRFVRQHSTVYVILSSTPRYWPFLQRPGNTSWTPSRPKLLASKSDPGWCGVCGRLLQSCP